jgi:hypothetical protein
MIAVIPVRYMKFLFAASGLCLLTVGLEDANWSLAGAGAILAVVLYGFGVFLEYAILKGNLRDHIFSGLDRPSLRGFGICVVVAFGICGALYLWIR